MRGRRLTNDAIERAVHFWLDLEPGVSSDAKDEKVTAVPVLYYEGWLGLFGVCANELGNGR
jgi:hypothetical protein